MNVIFGALATRCRVSCLSTTCAVRCVRLGRDASMPNHTAIITTILNVLVYFVKLRNYEMNSIVTVKVSSVVVARASVVSTCVELFFT